MIWQNFPAVTFARVLRVSGPSFPAEGGKIFLRKARTHHHHRLRPRHFLQELRSTIVKLSK